MSVTLDISPVQLAIVRELLGRYLPSETTVWVFGSRAGKGARKYSDLDLAIDAGRPIDPTLLLELAEELENSDLPYEVDLVDWQSLDERFRKQIEKCRAPLPLRKPATSEGIR